MLYCSVLPYGYGMVPRSYSMNEWLTNMNIIKSKNYLSNKDTVQLIVRIESWSMELIFFCKM